MKKVIISVILVLVLFSGGCSKDHENLIKDELTQLKEIAWDSLSNKEKKVVENNWERAKIEQIEQSKLQLIGLENNSTNVYRVIFNTTQDEMLGPIGIYIDADRKEIIGHEPRE